MIIVKLMGGLGNQMFQYATARSVAHRLRTPLLLDTTAYNDMPEVDTPRHYELGDLRITGKIASTAELSRMLPADFRATLSFRIRRRLGLEKRLRALGEPHKDFSPFIFKARKNTYLLGWWQNEKYFTDIQDILRKEFQPKRVSAYGKKILSQIEACDAISIHVRRGDYVTNKYANKEHGLASIDYYKRAVDYINSEVKKPRYFVFSDDMAWCKKNLKLGQDFVFVDSHTPNTAHEGIYLMQYCKHNIIANSSYSWWGAWLNNNPNKIVIAPKSWFQNQQTNQETGIVPNDWKRL